MPFDELYPLNHSLSFFYYPLFNIISHPHFLYIREHTKGNLPELYHFSRISKTLINTDLIIMTLEQRLCKSVKSVSLYDNYQNFLGKLFTGSSLTGRHLDIFVFPLSLAEFLYFKGPEIKDELDRVSKKIEYISSLITFNSLTKSLGTTTNTIEKKANKNKNYLK